jgi:hypothetical protein
VRLKGLFKGGNRLLVHKMANMLGALALCLVLYTLAAAVAGVECSEAQYGPKNVNVAVKTSFPDLQGSMLLETCEFFAAQSSARFFAAVGELAVQVQAGADLSSDRAQYQLARQVAGAFKANRAAFDLALSLRMFAPATQIGNSLLDAHLASAAAVWAGEGDYTAPACGVMYVHSRDTLGCEYASLAPAVADEVLERGVDRVLGPVSAREVVVVYADVLSPLLADAHAGLAARAHAGKIRYVLRLLSAPEGEGAAVFVQGFGVGLTIKNMEYKVLDDSTIEISEEEGLQGGIGFEEEPGEAVGIEGVLFDRLIERRPELKGELEAFRAELLAQSGNAADVNVWDLQHLGVQAAQRILGSAEPLEMLRYVYMCVCEMRTQNTCILFNLVLYTLSTNTTYLHTHTARSARSSPCTPRP